jgi:hypothetical protein
MTRLSVSGDAAVLEGNIRHGNHKTAAGSDQKAIKATNNDAILITKIK